MSPELKDLVLKNLKANATARLASVLKDIGVPRSTWYYKTVKKEHDGRRKKRISIPVKLELAILDIVDRTPWYGYKRISIICRREGLRVSQRQVYYVMRDHGLLKKKRPRDAALYQASKLYELLPSGANELWQMDVTYIHIPGHGWWYGVTVIDYYSRYLLALRLTSSFCATEVIEGLKEAVKESERIHGKMVKYPFLVTDNGSSFISKRFNSHIKETFPHVRIRYRTPTQLGLLERFHETLKNEEVYWRMYDNPNHAKECLKEFHYRYNNQRPHWALKPEEGGDPITPAEVYSQGKKVTIPKWQGWARGAKKKLDKLLKNEAA